jgi:hypothetical protein
LTAIRFTLAARAIDRMKRAASGVSDQPEGVEVAPLPEDRADSDGRGTEALDVVELRGEAAQRPALPAVG